MIPPFPISLSIERRKKKKKKKEKGDRRGRKEGDYVQINDKKTQVVCKEDRQLQSVKFNGNQYSTKYETGKIRN